MLLVVWFECGVVLVCCTYIDVLCLVLLLWLSVVLVLVLGLVSVYGVGRDIGVVVHGLQLLYVPTPWKCCTSGRLFYFSHIYDTCWENYSSCHTNS